MMRRAGFILLLLSTGCYRVSFDVVGDRAYMNGTINTGTPERVAELLAEHPDLSVIELEVVPGSVDDEACLAAGLLVREHGLSTYLAADGEIASGGVDFFLAGVERTVEDGGLVGVHSWSQLGGPNGEDLPRDDPEHQPYLDYLVEMEVTEDFYWFTLDAAPANDIHWMSRTELVAYDVITP
jgi:hypothetical protein